MTMTIRPVAPGDRDTWARLFVDYGVFYETSLTSDVVDGIWAWLMDAAHDVSAFVAVDGGGTPVGFAHYRPVPSTFTAASGWYLDDLYVDPDARGAGTAAALIEAVAEHARSHGGGTLSWITADDNARARKVYDVLATRTNWVTYEKDAT